MHNQNSVEAFLVRRKGVRAMENNSFDIISWSSDKGELVMMAPIDRFKIADGWVGARRNWYTCTLHTRRYIRPTCM